MDRLPDRQITTTGRCRADATAGIVSS